MAQVEDEKTPSAKGTATGVGKHLTFELASELYGVEILKVQEIIGMLTVTRVPRTPSFIRGVINLRGKVIPVLDLRSKFGLETQEDTERTCIIVTQIYHRRRPLTMGIIVDNVSEVVDFAAEQIEPPPQLGTTVDTQFILGMGKLGSKVAMLLDVQGIITEGSFPSQVEANAATPYEGQAN